MEEVFESVGKVVFNNVTVTVFFCECRNCAYYMYKCVTIMFVKNIVS